MREVGRCGARREPDVLAGADREDHGAEPGLGGVVDKAPRQGAVLEGVGPQPQRATGGGGQVREGPCGEGAHDDGQAGRPGGPYHRRLGVGAYETGERPDDHRRAPGAAEDLRGGVRRAGVNGSALAQSGAVKDFAVPRELTFLGREAVRQKGVLAFRRRTRRAVEAPSCHGFPHATSTH